MLFADGEARPEVYSAATVKDQAKICFADAVEIVKATDLKNYLHPYRNSIVYELKGGMMKPLSSDYGTHGVRTVLPSPVHHQARRGVQPQAPA